MKRTNFIIILCAITLCSTLMPMKRSFSNFESEQNSTYLYIKSENFIDDMSFQASTIPSFEEHATAIDHPLPDAPCTLRAKKIISKESLICLVCNKKFSQKTHLKTHINTVHEKLKPYKCNTCNALFSQKTHLKTHTRGVHEKLKPYTCKICSRSFSRTDDLNRHIERVHNGIKRYACEVCSHKSASRGDLNKHMKTHDKPIVDKPFSCNICNKSFVHKKSLTKHMKKHA